MRSPGRSTSMVKVMETSAHSRCQYGSIRRREETPPSRKRRPLAVPVRVRRPNPVQRLCTASRPARGTTRITRAAHVRTATPDAKGASHASVGSSKPLARRMDTAGPSGMIRGYCLLPGRVLSSRVSPDRGGFLRATSVRTGRGLAIHPVDRRRHRHTHHKTSAERPAGSKRPTCPPAVSGPTAIRGHRVRWLRGASEPVRPQVTPRLRRSAANPYSTEPPCAAR